MIFRICCAALLSFLVCPAASAAGKNKKDVTEQYELPSKILDDAPADAWRPLDPENTIYMDLPAGLVVIEMKPDLAPHHVAQIKKLVRSDFYNGLTFHRVIEGFMAQGGDPKGDGSGGSDLPNIPGEFTRDTSQVTDFVELGRDRTTPRIGYIHGMRIGAQPEALRSFKTDKHVDLWPLHCPGVMSMARATDPNSANSQFFLMMGDSRLNLDRKYTAWGWIVDGYEATRRIARGEPPQRPTPIMRMRIMADVPEAERKDILVMRTDTDVFKRYLEAQLDLGANGYIRNVCDIKVPVKVNGKIER